MTTATEPRNVTTRQRDVLRAMAAYHAGTGLWPRLSDLAGALSISKVTVYEHLQALAQRQLVRQTGPFQSRGYRLRERGLRLAQAGTRPDPLERLQLAWAEATPEAREAFLRQIGRVK